MIEGEEEIGSENLGIFVENNKEKLKADVILISDTGIIANDMPSITSGLRGLSYLEVEVTGPNRDLHSGLYGGAVANPINILCKMIASLHDENNHITIPGFYDNVDELSQEERAEMAKAPFNLEEYKKALDLSDIHGEAGYSTNERNFHPANVGCERHLGRLYRRRRQNGNCFEGFRQNFDAPGAPPNLRRNYRKIPEAF